MKAVSLRDSGFGPAAGLGVTCEEKAGFVFSRSNKLQANLVGNVGGAGWCEDCVPPHHTYLPYGRYCMEVGIDLGDELCNDEKGVKYYLDADPERYAPEHAVQFGMMQRINSLPGDGSNCVLGAGALGGVDKGEIIADVLLRRDIAYQEELALGYEHATIARPLVTLEEYLSLNSALSVRPSPIAGAGHGLFLDLGKGAVTKDQFQCAYPGLLVSSTSLEGNVNVTPVVTPPICWREFGRQHGFEPRSEKCAGHDDSDATKCAYSLQVSGLSNDY